jgi:RNA polymerase sigma-70 factor (ECF subfamily)
MRTIVSGTTAAPDGADDEELVTCAQRDSAAFALLYERHHATIFRFVVTRVPNLEAAEDITSQVFLNALRGLQGYRSGSFLGWLYQIARNLISDSYRRPPPSPYGEATTWQPDPGPGPADLAEQREAREEVQRIITLLPATQRQVIRLRLCGFRGQEIADCLGISLSAVKSAQFRAFTRIREVMSAADHGQPPRRRSN